MRGVFSRGRGLTGRVFLASFLVLLLGAQVWAQSAAMQSGLSWFAGNQAADGHWPSAEVGEFHATAEAVKTLTLLNPASPALTTGRAWLATQDSSPTDFLARSTVAGTGTDIVALLALRATSGGWGGDTDFAENNLDTPLALQALKAANHSDLAVLNPALAYLTTSQNADGGWGFYEEDASNVYMTAVVSVTLQQFPQMTAIATAVSRATDYLLAHQNLDGGFGSATSSAYETALAHAALVAVSTNEAALESAVNYLTAAQSANGSWNDDAYPTALALTALYLSENRPSPPPPPPAGGTITGTVVDATTNLRLSGVTIVLASDPLINTTTDNSGNFTLSNVPPGSQQINFSLAGYKPVSTTTSVAVEATVNLGTVELVSSYSTGTIVGTITDQGGKPLNGVTVSVTGAWVGTATTDTDGSYLFTYVTPGEVTITAAKAGFEAVSAAGSVYARTTLTFSPRMTTTPPQATTGTLVGRVVSSIFGLDLPIDHLPGEKGVTVTLTGGITAEPDTNNRGLFEIKDLEPGTYQATVGMKGFTSQTFRVVIAAGVTTDLGTIRLAMTISKMTMIGTITDAVSGAPISGAEVTVAGTLLTGRSGFDGSYAIANIDHPAEITVRASAASYTGRKFLVRTQPYFQTMNIALTPRDAAGQPTGTEVDVTVTTEKATYTKSDPVGLTVNLWNAVGWDHAATELVRITDPSGALAFETTQPLNLAAGTALIQNLSVPLPLSAPGGTYTATVELLDENGLRLGLGTRTFAVTTSRITVTPQLPAVLSAGANTLRFQLRNDGTIAVANGQLDVTLTDPNGAVLFTQPQTFALELGAGTTLEFVATLPALKFGTYLLSYVQSDATIAAAPVELSLPNTLTIKGLYDGNAHRIRSTAGLTVTLVNDGRFALVPAGQALSVTVAVPDADYTETKTLAPGPAVGNPAGSALLYQFVLPETLTASLHPTTITVTLPSGSQQVETVQLAILESALALAPLPASATAGEALVPQVVNSGGVDTPAQYTLRLLDGKAAEIARISGTETVRAGEPLALALEIPGGAVSGSYQVVASILDQKTGKEQIVQRPVTILGVQGELRVQTDKEEYLSAEEITALSRLTNTGTELQDGNLHLQVVTTTGTRLAKTWTTQEDFQTGSRNGVDTYGVNDWIIPEDNFEAAAVNTSIWNKSGNVTIQSGKLYVDASTASAEVSSKFELDGDFDIQVEFFENNSKDNGVTFGVGGERFAFILNNTIGSGYGCDLRINGIQVSWNSTGSYATSGRFRIIRTADVIAGYYWSGNSWVEIKKGKFPEFAHPAHIGMSIWRGPGYLGPNTTKYDNFAVKAGRIKTENQTGGSVRLLPFNDNFDDGFINDERWSLTNEPGHIPLESNGAIKMVAPVHTTNSDKGSRIYSNQKLTGDFDIHFDYDLLSSWRFPQNDSVDLLVYTDYPQYYIRIFVQRAFWHNGPAVGTVGKSSYPNWIIIQNTSKKGKLRINRTGNIYSSFYWNGSSWIKLRSEEGPAGVPTNARIGVWGQMIVEKFEANLDNFVLTSHSYPESGTVYLKHDSGRMAKWSKLEHSSTLPVGTSLNFRTRTADTEADLANALWSDYIMTSGAPITSPDARWIEVEATLATTDTNVTPLLHDLTVTYDSDPGQVLWETDVPANMAAGAIEEFNNLVGTLGVTGKLYLQGELTSSTGQTVATAQYPFYIEQAAITVPLTTDREFYRPGETVTVSGTVKNRSSVAAEALTLQVVDPGAAGEVLYSETFDLAAQGSRSFTFTTTAGADGLHALTAQVVQNGAVLVEDSTQYETASPTLEAVLVVPEAVGGESFDISLTLRNTGKVDAKTQVQVTDGDVVVGIEDVIVPAGEIRLLRYPYQIFIGTVISADISGDLTKTLTREVAYIAPAVDNSITVKIITDKSAYNPNDTVKLTATVVASAARANLTTLVTVTNSQGQALFSTTSTVANLVQGQVLAINSYWNVGNNPAGTYLVTLQAVDADGIVVSKGTCNLTISSVTQPAALLKGKIALDRQNILSSEPITASYSVTNVGNIDLANVELVVQTVTLDDQSVFQTIISQTPLAMGATTTRSGAIDTTNLSARDYLVVLRATLDGIEETLAGTYFRVEGAPTAPALAAPANGVDVVTFTPALVVSNAADPNDDRLSYAFEVYEDSGLTSLVVAGSAAETTGATAWTVSAPLNENHTYYWRARAYDGWLYSPWHSTASFRVNTVDDPPTAPNVSSPADGSAISMTTPTLTVTNASDPDSPALTYNFDLANDPEFTQLVASVRDMASGPATTFWTVPSPLDENGWYYWRAQAEDQSGTGPWSAPAMFQINTANDSPSAPAIVAPTANSVVAALATEVVAGNAVDPDSPMLSYAFEADTAETFDSMSLIRSGAIAEGQETTSWRLSGLLDNTWYHLRVKAGDGLAESPWSPLVNFFVNTVNDPPTVPTLDNPSSGSGVSTFTPTLSVRNATDLDGDVLTYDFEVYADAALTTLVTRANGVAETPSPTAWSLPVSLTENQAYFWRARASDGTLQGEWMPIASFLVNTANDAPGAPSLLAPADGAVVATPTPTLTLGNAIDPDNDGLSYDFEVYRGGVLVASVTNVPEGYGGTTVVTLNVPLADNTAHTWRARAFDGERHGPWMDMASFTVIIPRAFIAAGLMFEPETLNKKSQGQMVTVTIVLPPGYRAADVDFASLRLEETIPAEPRPMTVLSGANGDQLIVKFDRSAVIEVLPTGEQVPVRVTGTVKATPFEGADVIRVMDK